MSTPKKLALAAFSFAATFLAADPGVRAGRRAGSNSFDVKAWAAVWRRHRHRSRRPRRRARSGPRGRGRARGHLAQPRRLGPHPDADDPRPRAHRVARAPRVRHRVLPPRASPRAESRLGQTAPLNSSAALLPAATDVAAPRGPATPGRPRAAVRSRGLVPPSCTSIRRRPPAPARAGPRRATPQAVGGLGRPGSSVRTHGDPAEAQVLEHLAQPAWACRSRRVRAARRRATARCRGARASSACASARRSTARPRRRRRARDRSACRCPRRSSAPCRRA